MLHVFLTAPDAPDSLGRYLMSDNSDYAMQTFSNNEIDDLTIWALNRIVCYNQTIYDDLRLERDEYAGLSLGVKDTHLTTAPTRADQDHSQASILIIDNDSKCSLKFAIWSQLYYSTI